MRNIIRELLNEEEIVGNFKQGSKEEYLEVLKIQSTVLALNQELRSEKGSINSKSEMKNGVSKLLTSLPYEKLDDSVKTKFENIFNKTEEIFFSDENKDYLKRREEVVKKYLRYEGQNKEYFFRYNNIQDYIDKLVDVEIGWDLANYEYLSKNSLGLDDYKEIYLKLNDDADKLKSYKIFYSIKTTLKETNYNNMELVHSEEDIKFFEENIEKISCEKSI